MGPAATLAARSKPPCQVTWPNKEALTSTQLNNQCRHKEVSRLTLGKRMNVPILLGPSSKCLAEVGCCGSCLATTVPTVARQLRMGLAISI